MSCDGGAVIEGVREGRDGRPSYALASSLASVFAGLGDHLHNRQNEHWNIGVVAIGYAAFELTTADIGYTSCQLLITSDRKP